MTLKVLDGVQLDVFDQPLKYFRVWFKAITWEDSLLN